MSPSTKEELDSALATATSGDFSLGKGFLNAADDSDTLSQCLPDLHDPKTTHLYYTKGTYDMHEEGKLLAAKLLWENTWSKLDKATGERRLHKMDNWEFGMCTWALSEVIVLPQHILREYVEILEIERLEIMKPGYGIEGHEFIEGPLALVGLYMPWPSENKHKRLNTNRHALSMATAALVAWSPKKRKAATQEVAVTDLTLE